MVKVIHAAIQLFAKEGSEIYTIILETKEYSIIKVENDFVLVFFGSDSFADWIDNFTFFNTNLDSFPKGWHNQATEAFQKVVEYKIKYVTGYSRGAAIALIYSYYFNVQAICFSTPRVSKSLRYWNIKPLLISSLDDPVTIFPLGYKNPGSYIMINIEKGGHSWYKNKFTTEVNFSIIN